MGALLGGRFVDWTRKRLIAKYGNPQPEYRLYALWPSVLAITFGLLWYGWFLQYEIHYVVPLVCSFMLRHHDAVLGFFSLVS